VVVVPALLDLLLGLVLGLLGLLERLIGRLVGLLLGLLGLLLSLFRDRLDLIVGVLDRLVDLVLIVVATSGPRGTERGDREDGDSGQRAAPEAPPRRSVLRHLRLPSSIVGAAS
jgi:hypothetical protein